MKASIDMYFEKIIWTDDEEALHREESPMIPTTIKADFVPSIIKNQFRLLDINPDEIARQLTLFSHNICKIVPINLLINSVYPPVTSFSTRVDNWIRINIKNGVDPSNFFKIAEYLYEYGNYYLHSVFRNAMNNKELSSFIKRNKLKDFGNQNYVNQVITRSNNMVPSVPEPISYRTMRDRYSLIKKVNGKTMVSIHPSSSAGTNSEGEKIYQAFRSVAMSRSIQYRFMPIEQILTRLDLDPEKW